MEELVKTECSFLTSTPIRKNNLMSQCVAEIKDNLDIEPEIIVYGRVCKQRRDVSFFSDTSIGYKYSGKLAPSKPLTPGLLKILKYINKIYNAQFNGILINRYNTGQDYISAHSDDERNLDPIGVVAISHGESRIFRIRNKETKEIVIDIFTENNTVLHMGGDFQKEFTHEIVKEKGIMQPRYSFTFRKHIE